MALAETITAVNDAPVLADTALTITVAQNAGAPRARWVRSSAPSPAASVTSTRARSKALRSSATDETNGTWYYTTNAGSTWTAVGAVSSASSLLLADNASTRLYFRPTFGFTGSSTAALTLRAWDQTSGSAGTKVDTVDQRWHDRVLRCH